MPQISATVQRTIGQAATGAAGLIERCVDAAVTAMQTEELQLSNFPRLQMAAAWRELLAYRKEWIAGFPKVLRQTLEDAATGADRDVPASMPMPLASLSLVGDGEISRTLETVRLSEQLNSILDRQLRELDGLMSAAMGLPGVQPDRNPLRPQVYARALRELMGVPEREPEWPGLWLRYMAPTLAQELEQAYVEQIKLLTQAKVQAAEYRVLGTPSRPGGLGPAAGPAPGAPGTPLPAPGSRSADGRMAGPGEEEPGKLGASAFAGLTAQQVSGPQLQDFLFNGGARANWGLAASYYAQVDAELAELEARPAGEAYDARMAQQYVHLPAVDRPARHVGTESPLPNEVWGSYAESRERSLVHGRLKKQASKVGQVLGLEVVRKLVHQVAQDERLLAPVREAIVALEPSLLRLAMVAPRFFSEEEHPGRRLVERVAERSFKYNDEFSVDFQAFFGPVSQAFALLNSLEEFEDAEPFKVALTVLESGWAARDALDNEEQQKALHRMQLAEQRQAEADRIAWELGHRSDLEGVPDAVQAFLFGPWALVLAHARLTGKPSDLDPGGYVATISDLLWSVKPELTLREPAKAFEAIPRVLVNIRKGMTMIGRAMDDAETQSFFNELERLHHPILKLRARMRSKGGRETLLPPEPPPPSGKPPAAHTPPPEPGQIWLAPNEQAQAGFELPTASDFGALGRQDAAERRVTEDAAATVIAQLSQGSWVDLYAKQQWRRAQLVWASGKGTLFMFVSHGGQPHSMTKRILQKLVRERLVRPVDADAVVPRALQGMAAG